jgi:hypothetical protein
MVKEASSSIQGSKDDISYRAAELGMRLRQSYPHMMESGTPIYSSVSKSQLGYFRRVKDKIVKQLLKNKELIAEVVAETSVEGVEGYSKVVLDAVKFTPIVGLSCGGDEKVF